MEEEGRGGGTENERDIVTETKERETVKEKKSGGGRRLREGGIETDERERE